MIEELVSMGMIKTKGDRLSGQRYKRLKELSLMDGSLWKTIYICTAYLNAENPM